MKDSEFLIKISSFWRFYRWHPEVALRYLPLVEETKKISGNPKILEVGSGGLGIAPYLGRKVVGVDLKFDKPYHPLLKKIKASALNLPFADSSFDVVISADMLEHLEEKSREKVIDEMIRVGKKKIMIAVPCGKESLLQDKFLDHYYQSHFGKRFHFLEEQIKCGLPEKKEIYDTIWEVAKRRKKKITISVRDNENLQLRDFLMKGWMTKSFVKNIFFRKILLLFIPFLRGMNQRPVYRQLFIISLKNENSN